MKVRLITLIMLGVFSMTSAQSLTEKLKSADVIYVAPLTHYDYYALKRGAGEATKGAFDHMAEYASGDVTANAVDPNVSYEIVGKFSDEMLAKVNQEILEKLQIAYGADKVKPWPEEIKNKMTGFWDEKKIDCQYYIMFKRMTTNNPVMVQFFDASSTNPSSKPMIVGGGDMFTINLYAKEKAGKKGKAAVKVNHKITMGVDGILIGDDYKNAAKELVDKLNSNFPVIANKAVDEFIQEVSTQ